MGTNKKGTAKKRSNKRPTSNPSGRTNPVHRKKIKKKTDERLAYRKAIEEKEDIMRKLESFGILAGGIAHDFNNILTGILGNISLAKTLINSSDQAYFRLIEAERSSLRATELSNQLLGFSKGGNPVKTVTSIADMLGHSVQFALKGSNVRSQFFLKKELWNVEIDVGQMGQAIRNLVINAQQAMPEGGTLQVFAENLIVETDYFDGIPFKKGPYVKVSFKDFGSGIQEKHLSKIFDPYFTTKQEGSGLGLSLTFSIMMKHGGYVTAESTFGKGATFHLYLPANAGRKSALSEKQEEIVKMGKGKILLIDDEESVRDVVKVMLRHLGYEAETARGGKEGIRMFRKMNKSLHPYDLVISDLTIPGDLGGVEILKKLQEITPQAKVIVSSGYSNDPILADPRAKGFSDMIRKPYSIKELGDALFRVLVGRT